VEPGGVDRRELSSGDTTARLDGEGSRRATLGARGSEERLSWLRGGSAPDLTVAVSGGGHGGAQARGRGLARDARTATPFVGDVRAYLRPKGCRRRL
jgi:hypothetical protein